MGSTVRRAACGSHGTAHGRHGMARFNLRSQVTKTHKRQKHTLTYLYISIYAHIKVKYFLCNVPRGAEKAAEVVEDKRAVGGRCRGEGS